MRMVDGSEAVGSSQSTVDSQLKNADCRLKTEYSELENICSK